MDLPQRLAQIQTDHENARQIVKCTVGNDDARDFVLSILDSWRIMARREIVLQAKQSKRDGRPFPESC